MVSDWRSGAGDSVAARAGSAAATARAARARRPILPLVVDGEGQGGVAVGGYGHAPQQGRGVEPAARQAFGLDLGAAPTAGLADLHLHRLGPGVMDQVG